MFQTKYNGDLSTIPLKKGVFYEYRKFCFHLIARLDKSESRCNHLDKSILSSFWQNVCYDSCNLIYLIFIVIVSKFISYSLALFFGINDF
jgi:hypothetical protein